MGWSDCSRGILKGFDDYSEYYKPQATSHRTLQPFSQEYIRINLRTMVLNKLISQLPDGKAINKLVTLLRKQQEQEIMETMEYLLNHPSGKIQMVALKIVPRVINNPAMLTRLLDCGLEKKNISGATPYIRAIAPSLGYKKMLHHLKKLAQNEPEKIVYIWYSLVHEVLRSAPEELFLLKEICQEVDDHLVRDGKLRSFWQRTKDSVPL